MVVKPAWSWQFDRRLLKAIVPLPVSSPPTREWALEGSTGAGVKVAVVDSGIDGDHPDVGGVDGGVTIHVDESGELVVEEGPHGDLFGHGTACAAIIRAIAPDVSLFSVRVLGGNLKGREEAFAEGLRWTIENGIDVINLSLGTRSRDFFAEFHELVDKAAYRNIMLVAAMANVTGATYPGEYSSVFSVACDEDAEGPLAFAYNPRPPAEFGAAGIDVEVAWLNGTRIRATGNSFAAPRISGIVALVLAKRPGLTPFQMKTVLHALARNADQTA